MLEFVPDPALLSLQPWKSVSMCPRSVETHLLRLCGGVFEAGPSPASLLKLTPTLSLPSQTRAQRLREGEESLEATRPQSQNIASEVKPTL